MTIEIALGLIIRHLLTLFGGGAFVDGFLQGDTVNQVAGSVAALVGVGLSVYNKSKK